MPIPKSITKAFENLASFFKPAEKAAVKTAEKTAVKSATKSSTNVIKTTANITEGGVLKSVAKSTGDAVSMTAKVGKYLVPAGVVGVGGTMLYGYVMQEISKTPEQRQLENQLKYMREYLDIIQDYLNKSPDPDAGKAFGVKDGYVLIKTPQGGYVAIPKDELEYVVPPWNLEEILPRSQVKQESGGFPWLLVILGIGAVAGGYYLLSRKKKKVKK